MKEGKQEVEDYIRKTLKYIEADNSKIDLEVITINDYVSGINIKILFKSGSITKVVLDDMTMIADKYGLTFAGIKMEDGKTVIMVMI